MSDSAEADYQLVTRLDRPSTYVLRKNAGEEGLERIGKSSTLYVGNLSFYTTEEYALFPGAADCDRQIIELFRKCGPLKRVIMGLDRFSKTPCGFCFVEYKTRESALACLRYVSGTKLDERVIRCDIDPGFEEGRQYGRGKSGGQVRDDHRTDYDAGRGGYGRRSQNGTEGMIEGGGDYAQDAIET